MFVIIADGRCVMAQIAANGFGIPLSPVGPSPTIVQNVTISFGVSN
jgi:hypothetical protein